MNDTLILGGGVIGLSLAYELASSGVTVTVVDRQEMGREASWAGAGILPPAKFRARSSPDEWLAGFSSQLHPEWSARLREETGIDNGYRRCGGIYLAENDDDSAALVQTCDTWRRAGLSARWLHAADLDSAEPALEGVYDRYPLQGAASVAEEAQLRNPRHVKALIAANVKRGVKLIPGAEVFDIAIAGDRITSVRTSAGDFSAGNIVIACGAWTRNLAARIGIELPVYPIRGQIALLQTESRPLKHVVNLGTRYLVPRDDGRVLVGSTEEHVGFDRRTTAAAIGELLRMATRLAPALGSATLERTWCGFRPATPDGLPYLGKIPDLQNAFVAAGHFRQGLWLSTGTAIVMSRLIRGETPAVDLSPFRINRCCNRASDRSTTA